MKKNDSEDKELRSGSGEKRRKGVTKEKGQQNRREDQKHRQDSNRKKRLVKKLKS